MYNPFSLEGKNVLVTGASSGIGRATAIECSRMGARLIITGRDKIRLQDTYDALDGKDHLLVLADLADENQMENLVEQSPILDGLVNNAGITETVPVQFIKREKLEKILNINTIAPVLLTQKLLKCKKIRKGGSIVFTGSISGTSIGVGGNALYSVSKGAIRGFVINSSLDLSIKNIRVNEVCPGMIDTHIMDNSSISSDMLEKEIARYPMKRFGKPEEVAYGVIYLLSEASSFVTGASLIIDGGFSIS